ncbi:two-partner secretion domain-containing protein [Leptothoe kymatousa]|uniref:Filamentous hemagglutinin N-terminal domain-containing protein n=1 Tax=Leptothoe kymatousa TAU-MAC 1615 TaxID=2364775 RepID=A0ABS5XZQ9_9CYAN|nr:filamentous hemagglutinin N-terminal domain-containing protein [Leptothoe kymatousa]MBT9311055.1 filamentous hemagglutinin N-terminal domain-containing protein [Leptothoe kymatousa TAU-MAC 1615]
MHLLKRFLIVFSSTVLAYNPAQAQIIPDTTLGNESSTLTPGVAVRGGSADVIEGGATRGSNLFHSFREFNIDSGQRVYFASPDGIASILSRVTGGNVSSLAGTLGVDGPADLYLLNPNGITFTDTATLDITGSFYATTAAAIELGDVIFSASQPDQSQLLAVSPRIFFDNYLNDTSGRITSQGNLQTGNNLTLAANKIQINGTLAAGNNLSLLATNDIEINNSLVLLLTNEQPVPDRTLLIQGQTIAIEDSNISTGLFAQGSLGDIILIADGDVNIRATANNRTSIGSSAETDGTAGDLIVKAANLRVIDEDGTDENSVLLLSIGVNGGNGGDITLDVQDTLLLDRGVIGTFADGEERVGSAGNIRITATDFAGVNGVNISTATIANEPGSTTGDAGNIVIDLGGRLEMSGSRLLNDGRLLTSLIASNAFGENSSGNAGRIQITAAELALLDGAFISSSTSGQGQSGDITLDIKHAALLNGTSPFGLNFVSSGLLSSTSGRGDGGDIRLRAGRLAITDGAIIVAATSGAGNAGNVILEIEDRVQIDGTDPIGVASLIAASSTVNATGDGGDIRITANNLEVMGGARLSSSLSNTSGRAGNLMLNITETLRIQGANLEMPPNDRDLERRSAVLSNIQATGDGMGGDIIITATNLIVADGGTLDASVLGRGAAGDIVLNITETARFEGVAPDGLPSGTSAAVAINAQGTGGDLRITASNLEVLAGAQLKTSVFGVGDAGDIVFNIAETARFEGVNPVNSDFPSGVFSNVEPEGNGNGGDIQIVAQRLEITEDAFLSATNVGGGETGNIAIALQGPFLLANRGSISTATREASTGGNVDVFAQSIRLLDDGNIFATARTVAGSGGSITLTADSIVALDDSDILAFASQGRGGTISLNTPAFFGENLQLSPRLTTVEEFQALDNNGRVDVNVSGGLASGSVTLPEASLVENNLGELSDNFLDPDSLTASSCIARQNEATGYFVIAAGEQLSQQPEDSSSVYSTGRVQTIVPPVNGSSQTIAEPDRIFQLPDGRRVLSQTC